MIARFSRWLRARSPAVLTSIGLAAIALLAIVDYVAPPDLSFLLFYVGPALFLVWFVGRSAGFLGAALCAAFWVYEDVLSPHAFPSKTTADWNIAVRLVFLVLFVAVVAELKKALERERQAAQERLERDLVIAQQVQAASFRRSCRRSPGSNASGSAGRPGASPATTTTS